jgi:hypothetical protein
MAAIDNGATGQESPQPLTPWYESCDVAKLPAETVRSHLAWSCTLTNFLQLFPSSGRGGYHLDAIRLCESRQRPGNVLLIVEARRRTNRFASYSVGQSGPEAVWSWMQRYQSDRLSWRQLADKLPEAAQNGPLAAPPIPAPPEG